MLYWLVELMTWAPIVWIILQIMGLTCEMFVCQKKVPKYQLSFFGLGANSKALLVILAMDMVPQLCLMIFFVHLKQRF